MAIDTRIDNRSNSFAAACRQWLTDCARDHSAHLDLIWIPKQGVHNLGFTFGEVKGLDPVSAVPVHPLKGQQFAA